MTSRRPKDDLDEARDPSTTVARLSDLAESPHSFVRTAVAANRNTSPETLATPIPESADREPDLATLKALAWNPNASPATLELVAERVRGRLNEGRGNATDFRVGIALFSRFDTPVAVLDRLLGDPSTSTEFRKVVARQSGRPDVLDRLNRDRSDRVRRAAARTIDGR